MVASPVNQLYDEFTDEAGKKRRSYTDVFGNQVQTTLGYGATEATTTLLTSNVLGQRTKATDPRNLNTTYTLDTRGLLASKTSPDAGTTSHKYDKGGNLRFSQDANQAAAGQVYFTNYDFANRPLTSGQAVATFTSLDPDVAAAFEAINTNWLVVHQYDAPPTNAFPWSQFWAQISLLSLTNVSGRLSGVASKSNGAWQVTLFGYDVHGRVAARYTYTQNNAGSAVLTALNTTVTYTRDLRDAATQRTLTVGSSPFYHWYDYDDRGLLWKVFASTAGTKPATPDVTDTYRPNYQPADYQFQGGPLVPLKYTPKDLLRRIGDPATTTYPFSAAYTFFANGTVSSAEFYSSGSPHVEKRFMYAFTYDALQRLTSADYSGWSGTAWTTTPNYDLPWIGYDRNGNVTGLQRNRQDGTRIDDLSYGIGSASNRLYTIVENAPGSPSPEPWDAEAAASGSFSYDPNGNVKTAPDPYLLSTVTYDQQNLPISLTRSGTTTTYRYDDVGQRITKQVAGGNTEVYLREGATTLGVFTVNGTGAVVSSYFNVLAGDRVVGRQPSTGNRRYYHMDQLGSTRAVVDGATQAVLESYDFEPWGLLMAGRTLGSGTKETFSGKEQDAESGLDYFGARHYMLALARWAAVDPLAEKHPDWSPYNYVLDNPLALIDPDGRQVSATHGGALDPAMRLPGLYPSRPWVPGELATRGIVAIAGRPETRDMAAGVTPVVSTAQDAVTLFTGKNPVTGEQVGVSGRVLALIGLVTPATGAELRSLGRGVTFVVDKTAETRIFIRTAESSFEVSEHASQRMLQRGVSVDAVAQVMNTQKPFQYFHEGVWKTGFYDPASRTFVGTENGVIKTVIDNVSQNYIRNLQKLWKHHFGAP